MSETILVTSGTGKIGTAFVHLLASDARRPTVRVATRSPDADPSRLLGSFNPETVRPVAFDAKDAASLDRALDGVTRLFVIAPFGGDMDAWHRAVAAAAVRAATVRHVVKVSVTGARSPDSTPPPGRIPLSHWQGEEALRSAGLPTTCIRPTIFAQHFLTSPGLYARGDDRFYLPTGDAPIAFLDCRDIAAAAAALLALDDAARAAWIGRSFELTGPYSLTAAGIADVLSWVAGRRFDHVDGEQAFVDHCKQLGAPDFAKGIYAEAAGGWFGKVENEEFRALTGRRATSFAKFAFDHASFFSKSAEG